MSLLDKVDLPNSRVNHPEEAKPLSSEPVRNAPAPKRKSSAEPVQKKSLMDTMLAEHLEMVEQTKGE